MDVYSEMLVKTADVIHSIQPNGKVMVSAVGSVENTKDLLRRIREVGRTDCISVWLTHPYIPNPDKKSWPRHGVIGLSFDDTSFDQWDAALPLFAKYDARTTFFVVGTNRIDFMKKAMAAGHEIGLHGFRHRDAPPMVEQCGEDWFWKSEIAPQIAALNAAGIPVRSYAYPNTRRTERTDELFFRRGFTRVRGSDKSFPNPYKTVL